MLTLLVCALLAAPADDARHVIDAMDGRWYGTLTYRDFQTDQRVEIPMRAHIESLATFPGALRRIEFVDPDRVIESTDLIAIQDERLLLISPGDETSTETIQSLNVTGPAQWTLITTSRGTDNNQPADLRFTITMTGDELTWRRDVRTDGDWQFRNEVNVTRQVATTDPLLGAWTVDLRPTPASAAAPAPMVIESVDNGAITGTFYGSPIRDGHVNVAWGRTHFAFVTEDGSGVYHTTGVLDGDQISGTTHSLGREFLSVWRAHRDDQAAP